MSYYFVDVDVDEVELEGVTEFLVVREGTPTPRDVKVISISRPDSPN
jgi:hypothetical protein